jgi:tRNA splicing endonuclease
MNFNLKEQEEKKVEKEIKEEKIEKKVEEENKIINGILNFKNVYVSDICLFKNLFFGDSIIPNKRILQKQKEEKEIIPEIFSLTLEEAFYLNFIKKNLKIFENEKELTTIQIFHKFCENSEIINNKQLNDEKKESNKNEYLNNEYENINNGYINFIKKFFVFKFFSEKGWKVRNDFSYSCHYLLYKDGMRIDHAKYSLIISEKNKNEKCGGGCGSDLSFKQIIINCRINESVKKKLIFCFINIKEDINYIKKINDLQQIKQLFDKIEIKNILIQRNILT